MLGQDWPVIFACSHSAHGDKVDQGVSKVVPSLSCKKHRRTTIMYDHTGTRAGLVVPGAVEEIEITAHGSCQVLQCQGLQDQQGNGLKAPQTSREEHLFSNISVVRYLQQAHARKCKSPCVRYDGTLLIKRVVTWLHCRCTHGFERSVTAHECQTN